MLSVLEDAARRYQNAFHDCLSAKTWMEYQNMMHEWKTAMKRARKEMAWLSQP
jgi:hypothetical protein